MSSVSTPSIDAHLHVWDLSRGDYRWLTPEAGDLYASFAPEQARLRLEECGVTHALLVQAANTVADTEYMLDAARRHRWIRGVVGWVQLDRPGLAAEQLDRWQEHSAFRGVRHLVHDDPRDDFLSLATVRRSLRGLADRSISFEVPDAWPRHLTATVELAAALPNLRIVVDHLAKPPFGDAAAWTQWRRTLARVAGHANCTAKVSGLQVPGRPFTVAEVRPAWETALQLFGPDRLMWGSDWPMTVLTEGYAGTWDVMSTLIGELSPAEQAQLMSGTVTSVYGLDRPTAG